eukprot:1812535-Rhodomonas_salina.1
MECFQERSAETVYKKDQYQFKWALVNEFDLVFVVRMCMRACSHACPHLHLTDHQNVRASGSSNNKLVTRLGADGLHLRSVAAPRGRASRGAQVFLRQGPLPPTFLFSPPPPSPLLFTSSPLLLTSSPLLLFLSPPLHLLYPPPPLPSSSPISSPLPLLHSSSPSPPP